MFNERLKEKREAKGLSQAELARRVGVGRDSYNKYERAGIRPSHETLVLLAKELDTSVDYLLGMSVDNPMSELVIPEILKDAKVAFHHGEDPLTQDELDRVAEFAEFIRSQRKENK